MGTRFNLLVPGIDIPEGEKLFLSCTDEVTRIEKMLSCFISDSDISLINADAFQQAIEVNTELFEILENCIEYSDITQGTFDISQGKLIDQWNKNQENSDIEELIKETGSDKIILDQENRTVRFITPQVKIDLGAYGKGYALEKVQRLLIDFGISSAFISFGESSVCCLGKHPHGDYWPVGIQDFYDKDKSIATLKLINQSVSTSGNMDNNYHIIDPTKGIPVKEKKMISVKSSNALTAEVLSTALMIANEHQKAKIMQKIPDIEIIEVKYSKERAEVLKYNSIE